MVTYPRTYPTTPDVVLTPKDWNAMVDFYNGYTATGTFVLPASFTISTNNVGGIDYYYAHNAYQLIYGGPTSIGVDGTDCAAVHNAAIQAAGQGRRIFVKSGIYPLPADSIVDNVGVSVEGEHGAGDLFFSDDPVYGGYSDKHGVLYVDTSVAGIDMFKLGYKVSGVANKLTFGPRLKNLSFSGYATPPVDSKDTKLGCGVKCSNIQCGIFENLAFYHKEYGLYVTATNDEAPLNYSDVNVYDNLHFAYNKYGLYSTGAGGNNRYSNIWGYINHYNTIFIANYYDIQLRNVMSCADGYDAANPQDGASIFVACTYGDVHMRDIDIVGYNNNGDKTFTGLTLVPSGFKAHGKIFADNILVQGTDSHGIYIAAGGLAGTSVYLSNLYIGSPDTENVFGGAANSGDVGGAVVYNACGLTTKVYINGGYVDCEQASKWGAWFVDIYSIRNLENINPLGLPTPPGASFIDDTNNLIGLSSASTVIVPTASTDYTVNGVDLFITSTDSGNADNAIIIKDPAGNVITTAASTLEMKLVPLGYKINWGAFTGAAPTVNVYGM